MSRLTIADADDLARVLWPGAKQCEVELCGLNRYTEVTGLNLSRCQLTNVQLTNLMLTDCNLAEATLVNCGLADVWLTRCNLKRARFFKSTLLNVRLADCDAPALQMHMVSANWLRVHHLTGDQVKLVKGQLQDAHLDGCVLPCLDGRETDMRGVCINNSDLAGADLTDTNLRGAHITNTNLDGADLDEADLLNARLTNNSLNNVHWGSARLTNAMLDTPLLVHELVAFQSTERSQVVRLVYDVMANTVTMDGWANGWPCTVALDKLEDLVATCVPATERAEVLAFRDTCRRYALRIASEQLRD